MNVVSGRFSLGGTLGPAPTDVLLETLHREVGRQRVHGLAKEPTGEQVGAVSGVGVGHTQGVGQVLD